MRSLLAARRRPLLLVALAFLAAALSLLVGDSLRFDPWGWLRWGHELAYAPGDFSTVHYPSWKPLPVLITVPLATTGSLAPMLYLTVARAAGFVALALVFQQAWRRAGWVAAVVAVGALALVPGWWPTLLGGGIEPALVALGAAAFARHHAGHPGQAMLLGALVALGREEAVVLLLLYGLWLGRHDRRWIACAASLTALVLGLWLGGDWLGSGDPLHGGALARGAADAVAQRTAGSPWRSAGATVLSLFAAPLWLAALAAVILRQRSVIALVAAGMVWVMVDIVLAVAGYPIQARFLFPAAGLFSVAAGVGVAALGRRLVVGPPEHART